MGRHTVLLVNQEKSDAVRAAPVVRDLIRRHGTLVLEGDARSCPPLEGLDRLDLVVVLGGDGSLLAAVPEAAERGVALLGVNLGKLGFLAEFDLRAFERHAPSVLGDGLLSFRELGRLAVEVVPAGGEGARAEGVALNDVVITAGPPYRMIALSLSIDGEPGPEISGDGLIVSTPTGSTAYNLSAGGPILAPTVQGVAITPIAAHSLSFRPIVVDSASRVEISLLRANSSESGEGTTLAIDGRPLTQLEAGERIVVRRDRQVVRFVTNPDRSYWATAIDKLHWALAPRFRDGSGS
ncbi:MAG: NAD(+)/NADH kinase [Phycisphaeraceae bacterium]|nr:NAD(+)/NADH kinase [Phycisphaeraceae bacterium]